MRKGEIARTGPDVGHRVGRLQLHLLDDLIGRLGVRAIRAFEPVRGLVSHHVRDLAAHIKLADPIGVVNSARFVDLPSSFLLTRPCRCVRHFRRREDSLQQ